ncbi:MAG: tRNA-dihydrouridine synthase [Planctomycetota bacterium]|nr:tRNA-dihydrouridine synthase [Planctomycetota bacterium]
MSGTLNSFSIGNVQIDFPIVLAPLAGYTDLPYRLICRGFGAPYCTTEMMLDRQMFLAGKLRRRLVRLTDADHPIAGQLIGNEPDTMARAAKVLCEMGFDVVDLNFACPVRKALARRRGGYLMSRPKQAGEIVRAVVAASERPVTLKLRRSFKQFDEAFWDIAESAFDAGAAAITVHARSVEAKYGGSADWNFLAEVKRRFAGQTIIGSGDVLTPSDALRMLEQTGVNAAAVGRGALGNPWFFRQARDLTAGRQPQAPSIAEQQKLLAEHFGQVCELYGPKRGPKIMRKFGIKYARLHTSPAKVRAAFVAVKRPEQWQAVLEEFYADDDSHIVARASRPCSHG